MGMFNEELNPILQTLDGETLTDEEKELIVQEAREKFDSIDTGIQFKEIKDLEDSKNLDNDYKTSRNILSTNINRVEKLTIILFDNIAVDTTNVRLMEAGINVIEIQNRNIKLLSELQNKLLNNKSVNNKLNPDKDKKKKDSDRFSKFQTK